MKWLIPVFCPSTSSYGGFTRILAISEAALAAGHEIAFCASGPQAAALRQRGYKIYPAPETTLFGLPKPLDAFPEFMSQRVSLPARRGNQNIGDIWTVLFLTGYSRMGYLTRATGAVLAAIKDFQPDVLFTDLAPEGFLAARITGLPLACPYQSLVDAATGSWFWQRMNRIMTQIQQAHGLTPLPPEQVYYGPHSLKIVPSLPELDGADPARPDVRCVGQLVGEINPQASAAFQPEPGKRYVFAYLGTASIPFGVVRRVLPEVFPAGGDTICLVGAQSIRRPYQIGNVKFQPFVPADAVLPHCDWTICHGGQNTLVESALHGVPLLIFPGAMWERRFNAERMQATGAALLGEIADFNPTWFAQAFTRHEAMAASAAALGDRLRAAGGPPAAVEAITAWASENRSK